jgi:nucleolar protein 4
VEITKRSESFNTRRKLLESNPSLYISKTRLSIRQLPLYATDRTLKRLGIHAVKEFDAEVADGKRDALTREELQDTTLSPVALASKKNTGRKTVVMQSKVERQNDRIDGVTGMGRSKGYGFLEMRSHQDALKTLRWANNNPDVSALMKEWVSVELEELAAREKEKLLKAREAVPKPDDLDDQELKYKKLTTKVKEGVAGLTDQMKQGKTLLVEFSVENVQVVKRRSEKMSQGAGEGGDKPERERSRKRKVSLVTFG